jgi:hypothetical protein
MRREIRRKIPVTAHALFLLFLVSIFPANAEDLKKLAADLSARIHAAKHERVTVIDFVDLDKKPNKLGKYLAQQLQTALAEPEYKMEVIDQSHLGQLLEQMEKLSEGIIDPATGRQLGKMAGTEVLIVGTVMPSSLTVRLDIKAIDLQTAKVITGGSASMARLGIVDRLASGEEPSEVADGNSNQGKSGSMTRGASGKRPARNFRDQGVDFELEGCSLSRDALTCAVTVTSEGRDRWLAITHKSRAWNGAGDEYEPGGITVANLSKTDCAAKQILKDVPTRMTMTFPSFGADASMVERFRLYWAEDNNCYSGGWRSVEFAKISISEEADFSSPRGNAHPGGDRGSQGGGSKGKGGSFLDRIKDRATDIVDKTIDKQTRKVLGDDEPAKPPQP